MDVQLRIYQTQIVGQVIGKNKAPGTHPYHQPVLIDILRQRLIESRVIDPFKQVLCIASAYVYHVILL